MHPQLIAFDVAGRPLVIGSYGVMLGVAIAVAAGALLLAARSLRLELGASIAATGTAVGGGLAGAVVVHGVLVGLEHGSVSFALARPGLSMLGALLGAGVALRYASHELGLPALVLADQALPGVVLAQALARLGCFLGGCCLGHHGQPLPLYEATALLLLVPCLTKWRRSTVPFLPAGGWSLGWLVSYAGLRVGLDGLRVGGSQGLAACVLVGGLLGLCGLRGAVDELETASMRDRRELRRRRKVYAVLWLALACCGAAWTAAAQRSLALVQGGADDAPLIRAGGFEMGSDGDDVQFAIGLCRAYTDDADACQPEVFADEQPRHRVWLGAYRLDRTEVSRRGYERCVQHGVCTPPRVADLDARLALPEHPVTGVTLPEAQRYCRWLGGRLPSEAEWERAARGGSGRHFPWGAQWNARVANHGTLGPGGEQPDGFLHASPVTAFADGKSAYGLLNMAGNVWELTADLYDHDYYSSSERVDPRGPSQGNEHVIRGGSWRSVPHLLRATQRGALAEQESRPDVGFRCAYNVR